MQKDRIRVHIGRLWHQLANRDAKYMLYDQKGYLAPKFVGAAQYYFIARYRISSYY